MTIKDAYPIPRMDECIDSLGDARVFSTLDCNANYWQIPVAEEDKHLTAFTCLSGAWQCVRLPFGLCNALATFQRAIDMILAGVKWQICFVWHFRKKWTPFLCRRYMQGNVLSANVRHQQPMASARLWTGSNFPASRVHRPFTVSSTETSTEIGSRPQKNARPGGWSFHQPAVLHHGHPRVRYPSPRQSSTCCPSTPFSPIVSTRSAEVRGARQLGTAGGDAVGGEWVGWSLCRRLAVTAARSLRRGRSRRWVKAG